MEKNKENKKIGKVTISNNIKKESVMINAQGKEIKREDVLLKKFK